MPAPSRAISASDDARPGGAAVLQRLDEAAFDELERRFDQLLARERVAHLHGRALVRIVLAQLCACEHGRAADPVAAGRGAVEDDVRADRRRARACDPVSRQQADAHRVDEAVVAVRLVEDRLAADGRDADRVPVVADPGDCTAEVVVGLGEAQPVEERDRPRAHRHDVAEDPADAGRGSLERLDRGGMVVRLDLECDGLALAEVDHACVLAGALQNAFSLRREAASTGGPSACSRSAPTRAARRRRARSHSGRGRAARGCGRAPRRSTPAHGGAAVPARPASRAGVYPGQTTGPGYVSVRGDLGQEGASGRSRLPRRARESRRRAALSRRAGRSRPRCDRGRDRTISTEIPRRTAAS